jgi:hypothetical protein
LKCFSNVMVSLICPYSCILFSTCRAYADWGSLFFTYPMCSWYCCFKLHLVCPMYNVTGVAREFVNAAFFVLWGCVVRPGFYSTRVQSTMLFVFTSCFTCFVSKCCRNISAIMLETGEPIEIPLFGWYILS